MTDRYAVIGHPVAHSKSPEIHAAFAASLGIDLVYERLLAPLEGFRATVDAFRASGAKGANVTLPFKHEAYQYAAIRTSRAARSGAANVLDFSGDAVVADNTDGVGLVRDIEKNLGVPFAGKRVLLVGAGGAAHGVAGAIADAGPIEFAITNRTLGKADAIAASLGGASPLRVLTPGQLPSWTFDIIINATSASLSGELPPVPANCFTPGALAYDMMYGKGQTPFLALAAQQGATIADGLGMLVEQAAEAFWIWRGVRPDTAPVLKMLRER
jgi:shikimate dehydrogenase